MINLEAVKKSLVDQTIKVSSSNPSIIVNHERKNIKSKVQDLIENSQRFDIAVSYVVMSGLTLLLQSLREHDGSSRFLLTIEGDVTEPRALRELAKLDIQVKVFVPTHHRGFHMKSYLSHQPDHSTLLVGSANISSRAFGDVHEMVVEVESTNQGYIVNNYLELFEEIWDSHLSIPLEQFDIDKYEYERKERKRKQHVLFETLSPQTIVPNAMQEEALRALEACRKIYNRGLVIAATGTGKTYLSAFDVQKTQAKKLLFLVHNRLILTSAIDSYKKIFKDKRIIELKGDNVAEIEQADFIFTTDKTAYRHLLSKLEKDYFDYMIFDEAHKIGADTKYAEIIEYFTSNFTLGITATPERTDDPDYLFEMFQYSIPYEIRLLEAMNANLVCSLVYFGISLDEQLYEMKGKTSYIFKNYKKLACFIKAQIEEKSFFGDKLKGIIFCQNQEEARGLASSLNEIGYRSVSAISDGTSREAIDGYIKSLQSDDRGTIELICVVDKFNEGVDIPDVNVIVMLRSTQSAIVYTQQLGRGLRKIQDPNKYVTVLDLIGNSNNNYSIAQVLTGNETVDQRKLLRHVNEAFISVSPNIHVQIDKLSTERIIKSISQNFKVNTQIKQKFTEELNRFEVIPNLVEMYQHPHFQELELLQLLEKNFYTPLGKYYFKKYHISLDRPFLRDFFNVLMLFVFRGYNLEQLKDYHRLLSGEKIENQFLANILLRPEDASNKIPTAVFSEYYKRGKDHPVFIMRENAFIFFNQEIITKLKELKAYELFLEHLELIEHLIQTGHDYRMKTFDLVEKAEFLLHTGSKDCYLNAIGEKLVHETKRVYCPIQITVDYKHYPNTLLNEQTLVYQTQRSRKAGEAGKQEAIEKVSRLQKENYEFHICASFPHLGYSNTAFFNLGKLIMIDISEPQKDKDGKHNHSITFQLAEKMPAEFMYYRNE